MLEAWVRGERSPELDGWRGEVLGDLLAGCQCLRFEYSRLDQAAALFDELAARHD
jgi:hypothetical protein